MMQYSMEQKTGNMLKEMDFYHFQGNIKRNY